jgi:hypothetical protein
MKKTLFLLALSSSLLSFSPFSGIDDIISSLGRGGAPALSRYFDDNVEMTILERGGRYSKDQAQMVLRDFFNTHPVLGFEISQKTDSGERQYCSGKLMTSKGHYKTSIIVSVRNQRPLITEIRIEKN